jgi:hypothetical protein
MNASLEVYEQKTNYNKIMSIIVWVTIVFMIGIFVGALVAPFAFADNESVSYNVTSEYEQIIYETQTTSQKVNDALNSGKSIFQSIYNFFATLPIAILLMYGVILIVVYLIARSMQVIGITALILLLITLVLKLYLLLGT